MFFCFVFIYKEKGGRIQRVEDQVAKIVFKYSLNNSSRQLPKRGIYFISSWLRSKSFYQIKFYSYFIFLNAPILFFTFSFLDIRYMLLNRLWTHKKLMGNFLTGHSLDRRFIILCSLFVRFSFLPLANQFFVFS